MASLCGGSSQNQVAPTWIDPLGPGTQTKQGAKMGMAPTGAVPLRTGIFGELPGETAAAETAGTAAGTAATAAAQNPGNADAANLATNQINGDYLFGSPALDAAMAQMRGASTATGANNNAQIRSGYARNGMGFSTANQEAQQSNDATTLAGENNAEAQARLANYTNERNIQQTSPTMLNQALAAPINYLQEAGQDYLAPLSQEAGIIQQLSSGTGAQPDTVVTPNLMEQMTSSL